VAETRARSDHATAAVRSAEPDTERLTEINAHAEELAESNSKNGMRSVSPIFRNQPLPMTPLVNAFDSANCVSRDGCCA
jgi:hypothetical protein